MIQSDTDCSGEIERIAASDLPDLEKLARAFDCISGLIVRQAEADIELARALEDGEELLKTQIKKDTMLHARSVFEFCYRRVVGRRPWYETA